MPASSDAKATNLVQEQARQGPAATQPPQFRDEYVPIARELAQLGGSDEHLQRAFNITESTLADWRAAHADFDEACRAGTKALGANLYRRALGYDSEERKVVMCKQGPVVLKEVRHIPSDPRAAALWLERCAPKEKDVPQESPEALLYRQLVGTNIRPKEQPRDTDLQ